MIVIINHISFFNLLHNERSIKKFHTEIYEKIFIKDFNFVAKIFTTFEKFTKMFAKHCRY